MKKTINKIMCLLAVLVLCLPMLNLCPVSATEPEEDIIYPPYYGIECFEPHEDGSGFHFNKSDISSSGNTFLPFYNHITSYITEDEYHSNWCQKVDEKYRYLPPYLGIYYASGYRIANIKDKYYQFVSAVSSSTFLSKNNLSYSAEQEYYYLTFFLSCKYDDSSKIVMKDNCYTIISETPITVKQNSDGKYYFYGSELYCSVLNLVTEHHTNFNLVTNNDEYFSITVMDNTVSRSELLFDENMNFITEFSSEDYYDYECSKIYTNCNIDTSMFSTSDNLQLGISDLKQDTTGFSKQIDVKLTPEFGLDMDRTFDPLTGQDDYFKFEVTNNSETSVQFCLSIKDRAIDVGKGYEGQVIEDVFQGIGDWEDAHWNYITDTYYYADSVDQIKRVYDDVEDFMNNMAVLVPDVNFFPDDYIRYAELQKGNFYWVLLKPGETYEDYIYWSNVNIEESKSYSFICDVVPTSLEYPTDIFYYVDEETGTKYYAPNSDLPTSSYHLDIENTTDKYAVKANDCYRVCNYVFSVYSVPTFSSTVVGGNSAITSGWDDTVSQADNPYYRYNTSTESMIPVSDYSAFMPGHAHGGVVDIDFDNVGINDVKNYIKYSQGYFELLRSVFQVFPAVWVLIVFGLGAIIVIAIIRFIKG